MQEVCSVVACQAVALVSTVLVPLSLRWLVTAVGLAAPGE